jgi:class 3 adenylate cyclase
MSWTRQKSSARIQQQFMQSVPSGAVSVKTFDAAALATRAPAGAAGEQSRVMRALAFADALKRTIETASQTIGNGEFATRIRIGIDSGMAVAVNSGRGSEPEPLFLGSPANYAAKLAEGLTRASSSAIACAP